MHKIAAWTKVVTFVVGQNMGGELKLAIQSVLTFNERPSMGALSCQKS